MPSRRRFVRPLIVYYSRTGTTAKVAGTLAESLGANVVEIKCKRYRSGHSAICARYDSIRENLPPIDMQQKQFLDYDSIMISAPIWTSYPALPLRIFLTRDHELPARAAPFVTYDGHSPPAFSSKSTRNGPFPRDLKALQRSLSQPPDAMNFAHLESGENEINGKASLLQGSRAR